MRWGRRRYKDDPSVVKSKQEFKLAKKAYKRAQRKANAISTHKNIKEENLAFNKFKSKKIQVPSKQRNIENICKRDYI